MTLRPGFAIGEAIVTCREANEALTYAILAIFPCGFILIPLLEPVAISKALKAKKMIEKNPLLDGSGKATAALIIACVSLVLWVLGVFVRVTAHR